MLKQRLITAAVLIPIVVLSILNLDTATLFWPVLVLAGLAAWEWLTIIGVYDVINRAKWIAVLFITTGIVINWLPVGLLLMLGLLFWLLMTVMMNRYGHSGLPEDLQHKVRQKAVGITASVSLLTLFCLGTVTIHQSVMGPQQLLFVLVAVWLADTGGYFAGKRWGKTALAKAVSPNKTWQGVWGAVVLSSLWAILAYLLDINSDIGLTSWLILTQIAVFASIIGDLFESLFKRSFNVKDSGRLLPGHGGILDRIDSLIAAVPVFAACLILIGAI